jgi:hypothetical protein
LNDSAEHVIKNTPENILDMPINDFIEKCNENAEFDQEFNIQIPLIDRFDLLKLPKPELKKEKPKEFKNIGIAMTPPIQK